MSHLKPASIPIHSHQEYQIRGRLKAVTLSVNGGPDVNTWEFMFSIPHDRVKVNHKIGSISVYLPGDIVVPVDCAAYWALIFDSAHRDLQHERIITTFPFTASTGFQYAQGDKNSKIVLNQGFFRLVLCCESYETMFTTQSLKFITSFPGWLEGMDIPISIDVE